MDRELDLIFETVDGAPSFIPRPDVGLKGTINLFLRGTLTLWAFCLDSKTSNFLRFITTLPYISEEQQPLCPSNFVSSAITLDEHSRFVAPVNDPERVCISCLNLFCLRNLDTGRGNYADFCDLFEKRPVSSFCKGKTLANIIPRALL